VTETLDRQCERVLQTMREGAVDERKSPETMRCIIRISTVEAAVAIVAALEEKSRRRRLSCRCRKWKRKRFANSARERKSLPRSS